MHPTNPIPATLALTLAAGLLAACAPPLPDSRPAGSGFGDPAQQREAILTGQAPLQPPLTDAEALARDTRSALGRPYDPVAAPGTGPAPYNPVEAPADPFGAPLGAPVAAPVAALDRDNPQISQEQDFSVVSAERDIQADAERLRLAREQYRVATPQELERPGDTGPNVIAYAVRQARPVGDSGTYGRGAFAGRSSERKCASYSSGDLAQQAFLSAGGPERDRLGLDPDGDGNACGWDPAVFRNLTAGQ